jgi:dihydropteroate synthase
MGILNVTPDSFYDGGAHFEARDALDRAEQMADQGADVLDVGGESTRPFSQRIGLQEELARIEPVIERILRSRPDVAVSVDTYKAAVAARVLEMGASIVNDVTACSLDPELTDVLAQYKPGYVLMHSKGRPEDMQRDPRYDDVVEEVRSFFDEQLNHLVRAGVPEDRVVLDPGIGFGKGLEHNIRLLREIDRFFAFGRPVMLGVSNKSMWRKLLGLGPQERHNATQVCTALAARRGVCLHRVHEVDLTVQTLRIVQSLEPQASG